MTTSPSEIDRELAAEQAHVDLVYRHLDRATRAAMELVRQGRAMFQTDRDGFVREEDMTAMYERDAFSYQAARRLSMLNSQHEGLVFGRLDLATPETRYIGRIGVRDEDYEPLVLDWRAPASEPFYRATATDPMNVVRRRVLRCQDEVVVGIEDDLLDGEASSDLVVVGEGALMASLRRARGHTMRDIVATIQAEQDQAIRAPHQGVTLISGGPGTGKSVVALHRAAYLLYTFRARLEHGGVLVVGPSSLFIGYIERVLPSLGEDSVTLKAIGGVASDVLGIQPERHDAALASTVKGSLRMLDVLRRLVREPLAQWPDEHPLRLSHKGEAITATRDELARIRDEVLRHERSNLAQPQAEDKLVARLLAKLPSDAGLDMDDAERAIREHPAFTMLMRAWWPQLGPTRVLARLADPDVVAAVAPELSPDERRALVESYSWIEAARAEEEHDPVHGWSVADAALLDELVAMLGPEREEDVPEDIYLEGSGVRELVTTQDLLTDERDEPAPAEPHDTFGHVLVDEAQDLSPMQWRMLRRRGPSASWTIVGDPAQASYPDQDEAYRAMLELVGDSQLREFRLSTNYRSPAEVFDLAGRVIRRVFPQADLPVAVRSTGVMPEAREADPDDWAEDMVRAVVELAGQVEGTIGVVCPPSMTTAAIRRGFADPAWAALDERTSIVDALRVKGLEYDATVVLAPDKIVEECPGGVRVLYVALTRATQRLITLDLGTSEWRFGLE